MKQSDRVYYIYAYLRHKDSPYGAKYSPYYIGKGKARRAFSDKRTIKKPASKEFIVFIQEGLTEQEAFALEKYCIALYGRINTGTGILRNLSDGDEGVSGAVWTEEKRQKLLSRLTGRKHSEETKRKMSQSQKGRVITQEARQKIAAARKGKKLSIEHRKKIALGGMGRVPSEETRTRISKAKCKHLYRLTSPSGDVYVVDRLAAFCGERGLSDHALRAVARGKRNHYHGWKAEVIGAAHDHA